MATSKRVLATASLKRTLRPHPGWDPPALRWYILVFTTFVCWTLIAVLQYYLVKSQREGGVIFADNVNDLPLRRSFVYLYLPTIFATVFSIFIAWIDIDAKRFEPYRQLAQPDGALGRDSLLLHYPFDFMPFIPIVALKNRHWLVFWASLATVLTTFGIVPVQAGIFSTARVVQVHPQDFVVSQKYIHASDQERDLTLSYARSAYGILELNDTLPAYMTMEYTLAPFTASGGTRRAKGTWTANTTLYSLDLHCEEGRSGFSADFKAPAHFSSNGCFMVDGDFNNQTTDGPPKSITQVLDPQLRVKTFSAMYLGRHDYYDHYYYGERRDSVTLPLACNTGNVTFFAAFVRNKAKEENPRNPATTLFCRPDYYEQPVEATVDAVTKIPTSVLELGGKRPLASGLFNTSIFEQTLSTGSRPIRTRDNSVPMARLPRYLERMSDLDLTPAHFGVFGANSNELPAMLAMALTTSGHDQADFLDPRNLADAYRAAYRLMFIRAMTDVLNTDFSSATIESMGQQQSQTEAVILEPVFTYIVEGLLALVSLAAIALLWITVMQRKKRILRGDPGAIAAVMSLTAESVPLLTNFEDLDCCSTRYLQDNLMHRRFKLTNEGSHNSIVEAPETSGPYSQLSQLSEGSTKHGTEIVQPIRPNEFRSFTVIPFITLFVTLSIVLAVLFAKSKTRGLPLPSDSRIVQGLVREYLPTAIATCIEPVWILINRLLCMLQPLEELQRARAPAAKSISLNYNSVPPQLTILKAARSGHFLLASVCGMALLANVLATAFAGLLFQEKLPLSKSASFLPPLAPTFVSINGSSGPSVIEQPTKSAAEYSGAYQGGTGEDQFLVAESNYTRNTSLPSWTDKDAMYLPFFAQYSGQTENRKYQARTKYFSAEPNCKPLVFGDDYHMQLHFNHTDDAEDVFLRTRTLLFDIQIPDKNAKKVTCYPLVPESFGIGLGQQSQQEDQEACRIGKLSAELVTTLTAHPNATQHEYETCSSAVVVGWMRTTNRNCIPTGANTTETLSDDLEDPTPDNTFLMSCHPSLTAGDASVLVDSEGVLQEKARDVVPDPDQTPSTLEKYSTNGVSNLIAQSNLYFFRTLSSTYHNDSFASEHIHYFMNRASGDLRLTDPNEPLPQFEDVEQPMRSAYKRLFAIWLGVNKELLFVLSSNATVPVGNVTGIVIAVEERILFNTPLFIVSEVILSIYIIMSITIYLRRPGRYLARMPTSIAAVIALFAASAAVRDLQGTSNMTSNERERYMDNLGCSYGYGSYIGGDGSVHVGIEKAPFVRRTRQTTFEHSRADRATRKRAAKVGGKADVIVQYEPVHGP